MFSCEITNNCIDKPFFFLIIIIRVLFYIPIRLNIYYFKLDLYIGAFYRYN